MQNKPLFWDEAHSNALSKLSAEFVRFTRSAFGDFTAFQDLVWWGFAKERRESIVKNGVPCGELIFIAKA